jgi:hypothetical protein
MWVAAIVTIAGCAQPAPRPTGAATGAPALPKPSRVVLYDFVVAVAPAVSGTDTSVPVEQRLAAQAPTAAEGPIAREVAAELGDRLVERVRAMGLAAERAAGKAPVAGAVSVPNGSLLIEGQVRADVVPGEFQPSPPTAAVSITGLLTTVQTYFASEGAPRLVDRFARDTPVGQQSGAGGSAPGRPTQDIAAVYAERAADEIARRLSQFFASQGWIAAPVSQ